MIRQVEDQEIVAEKKVAKLLCILQENSFLYKNLARNFYPGKILGFYPIPQTF